ncbi:MAG: hypothetical protein J5I93_14950 [Pirellulaceae bacterium]|nr:hypothetical protein [Pirellulaceae bacterium]
MNVVVLYNEPGDDAAVDEQDVWNQRDAVLDALRNLGHDALALGCTLDLAQLRRTLLEQRPDLVFNLVESLGGTDRLMPLATLLLEALRIPYTGARTNAILATADKRAAKQQLRSAGLPTPDWLPSATASSGPWDQWGRWSWSACRWIIKPVWEHASLGMEDDCVVLVRDVAELRRELDWRERRSGRPLFAERFVDGREFNLSLLAGQVLPPAEIDFTGFPPGKPRIVGRRAKWQPDSFEYQQTPRRFDFPESDASLLQQLQRCAADCWRLFDLTGFARVDIRVDGDGQPQTLEVNVNPCLAPDAGFAAALARAGISFEQAVGRIVSEAL